MILKIVEKKSFQKRRGNTFCYPTLCSFSAHAGIATNWETCISWPLYYNGSVSSTYSFDSSAFHQVIHMSHRRCWFVPTVLYTEWYILLKEKTYQNQVFSLLLCPPFAIYQISHHQQFSTSTVFETSRQWRQCLDCLVKKMTRYTKCMISLFVDNIHSKAEFLNGERQHIFRFRHYISQTAKVKNLNFIFCNNIV